MMKTKFLNIPWGLGLTLLAAVSMLSACVSDFEGGVWTSGGGGVQREVYLELKVPSTMIGLEDLSKETTVDDLYVLAFRKGQSDADTRFEYYVKAEKNDTEGKKWKAKLNAPGYEQTFVLVANVGGAKDDMITKGVESLKPETDMTSVQQMLLVELKEGEKTGGFNGEGVADVSPFTLSGQTDATLSDKEGNTLSVQLHRIVARIQVYFGDKSGSGLANFEPETVRLYNFSSKAQVIPATFDIDVEMPSIPVGGEPLAGEARHTVEGNHLKHPLYLYETAQPADDDDDAHIRRPCLVIGGRYNESETITYYRVDLKGGDETAGITYRNVLRNHSYDVTVTKVSGEGEGSEGGALTAQPADIEVTVQEWSQTDLGDVTFDGENFLGLGTMEFSVGKFGHDALVQTVTSSKGLNWKAELLDEDGEGTPGWIRFDNSGGSTATGGGGTADKNTEDLTFSVDEKKAGETGDRTALMRFKAGRLQIDAKVVQTDREDVFIRLLSEETVKIANQDGQTNEVKVEYGPANAELVWVLTQDPEQGIGLTGGYQDGSESGDRLTNEKTLSIPTNALSVTDKPYVTGQATILLMARNAQGDAQMVKVRLVQKKLGVELVRKEVYALGKEETVYVRSNFDWTATFDKGQLTGGLENLTTGFTQESFEGVATDENNNDNAKVVFAMLRPEQWSGKEYPAEITFTSKEDDNFTCTVNMMDVFNDGNNSYLVKGYERTYKQLYEKEWPEELDKSEWVLPSMAQANLLTGVTHGVTWTSDLGIAAESPGRAKTPGRDGTYYFYTPAKNGDKLNITYQFQVAYASNGQRALTGDGVGQVTFTSNENVGPNKIPAVMWLLQGGYALSGVRFTYQGHDNAPCSYCSAYRYPTEFGWGEIPNPSNHEEVVWNWPTKSNITPTAGSGNYPHNCKHLMRDNSPSGHCQITGELLWTGTKSMNTYFLKQID